jgi:anaerobic selenocysteine-containing dehydrogenase
MSGRRPLSLPQEGIVAGGGPAAGFGREPVISRRRFLGQCGRCAVTLAVGATLPDLRRGLLGGEAAAQEAAGGGAPEEVAGGGSPLAGDVDRWSRSVCDLCGLGEPVFLGAREGKLVAVKGIPRSRTGFGRLCPRARALTGTAAAGEDRALQPLVRRDPQTKGTLEGLEPVSWDEALATVAERFRRVRESIGAGGVAVLASDGETCETYSVLARLVRAGMGTDHLDTPARLDALHAYDACADVFGVAANPGTVEDVDAADLCVLIGGDLAESHPNLFYRVLDGRRAGTCRVLLVDFRKTLAAGIADLHLRPRPGRELAAVNALAGRRATGIDAAPIAALRDAWNQARKPVTIVGPTALGSPTGAALAHAVARLHRETERWGSPGKGPLFLPRGANATGVVAFGIRPGWLPAGGRLDDPGDREKTAREWGVTSDALPARPGLTFLEWPAAVREGRLGALLVHRTNAAAEMPDSGAWRDALRSAFTAVTSTHVPSETTLLADVVLPLGLVSGESSGTMMTLDRRCQLLERATEPPGEARDAERTLTEIARAIVAPGTFERLFPSSAPEWDRWRAISRGTPFEAGGISFSRLRQELDVPWPCASEDEPGAVRMTADGAADPVWRSPPVPSGLGATVGPLREHFRSRVRTGRTAELHYEAPTAQLEMHPDDGSGLGLTDGDWVTVTSERGSATARLWLTDRVIPGVLFLPEHYGFLSDVQGGSATQKEPEGLAHLLTTSDRIGTEGSPAGLLVAVSVRKARRRDMRRRGM